MIHNVEIDINNVVDSLLTQIAQQAKTIAILDANVTALKALLNIEEDETEKSF